MLRRRRLVSRTLVAGLALIAGACGKSSPQPPVVTPPSGTETVTGNERIGWDQRAGDNAELATIRYAVYVDATRAELTGVTCSAAATSAGYACTAPLPRLTAGAHTLEIASFVQDGSVLESARSAALRVNVTGVTPPAEGRVVTQAASWPRGVQAIAGLQQPSDLAIARDGRVFIAEHSGRIRVAVHDHVVDEPAIAFDRSTGAGEVLSIALDPDFERTRFLYAVVTERMPSGALGFALIRLRESGNTLADAVVLLDGVRASAEPHAAVRIGPDRKLYVVFDDGGDARLAQDAAAFNGKLLRLNPDGTTPGDQPRGSPILSTDHVSPRGLAWHRSTGRLWMADAERVGSLAWTVPVSAVAFQDDAMFVAAADGLTKLTIDARAPNGVASVRRVLRDEAVTAVAIAPDGRIYFATATMVGVFTTDAYR